MAQAQLRSRPADGLRPTEFLGALRSSASVLEDHAAALDRLDAAATWSDEDPTDPVPADPAGGPGTDLARTLGRACGACGDAADLATICADLTEGARAGAASLAGRRLARFLSGAGEALRNADRVDGLRMALALEAGAERLAASDDGAHPGGLPAVVAAAADAALSESDSGADLGDVLVAAADAGLAELEQGPLVDPRLAERGTVDATAAGFLLILDSLASVVTGEPLPSPPAEEVAPPTSGTAHHYVVRCRVTPPRPDLQAAADLEALLHQWCRELRFHGTGATWTVDLVTAHPGTVVEALAGSGVPSELHIAVVDPAHGTGSSSTTAR